MCKVVCNRNRGFRLYRALPLAFHASYASGIADFHDNRAAILGGALRHDFLLIRNHQDNLLRADFSAGTAAFAGFAVDFGNAIYNMHCFELAGLHTGSKADTGEFAVP